MFWIRFKDENNEEKRIPVDRDIFAVGRHSTCDLTYTDNRLSREHLIFEREGSRVLASDPGSSNGTTVNGNRITAPVELKNGDVLDLGGGLEITMEFDDGVPATPAPADSEAAEPFPAADTGDPMISAPVAASVAAAAAQPEPAGGIPTAFFIAAPLLALLVLAILVVAVVLFRSDGNEIANSGDDITQTSGSDDDDPDAPSGKDEDPTPKPSGSLTPVTTNSPSGGVPPSSPAPPGTELPPGSKLGETAKIEQNSAAFLRQIAQNDPRAFLTGEQATKVNAKVSQLGRSSALADNLNSARKNAAAIKSLAASKNLKPQFLAVAAITKMGSTRGDALQAAQNVADVYDQLVIQVGNENFDDALLMVAAYDQAVGGDTMKMRNMLQDLATKSSEGTRTIRSIWFLERSGKITAAEYDRALTFLAIGTIAQNPKDFGVNAEALKL